MSKFSFKTTGSGLNGVWVDGLLLGVLANKELTQFHNKGQLFDKDLMLEFMGEQFPDKELVYSLSMAGNQGHLSVKAK